ncbi:MAG: PAS domain-containing protein [Hyphomicrobiales bacterium]|nr:PAS domain-containing protein [Hyphomicrobiales bacterium]
MPRVALAAAMVFVATLAIIAATLTSRARRDAFEAASNDLELIASAAEAALRKAPANATQDIASQLPSHAFARGRVAFLTNGEGDIIAATPAQTHHGKTLADTLGPGQLVTFFAEKAGVMEITLPGGVEAFAVVRNLPAPLGQIAFVHPLEAALAEQSFIAARINLLLGATAALLVLAMGAYQWQARRARETEDAADRLRERIGAALSRGRCGLWDWDVARGRIYWSNSMYEMLGMEPQDRFISVGELHALMHPADGGVAEIAEAFASGAARSFDKAFRLRNTRGEWVWLRARAETVEQNGQNQRLIGIAVDISEQKSIVEQNARQDALVRDAIETISEAFVLWDADKHMVMCNTKFRSLHGIAMRAPLTGASYEQVMAAGSQSFGHVHPPLHETATSYETELDDGRWMQINERRTRDGGFVSVGTDITNLKQHEEKLLDSERRLTAMVADLRKSRQTLERQTQALAELAEKYYEQKACAEDANRSKSEFLANMSHELRTPLNAILGFAEMMQAQVFGPLGSEHYADYCGHIRKSGEYLMTVISDVLDMSRLEAGRVRLEHKPIDLALALDNCVTRLLREMDEKGIALDFVRSENAFCAGDRNAIEKSLAIILRNAIKYTPEAGRISIRMRACGSGYNIFIADSGCGIATDSLKRICRPFEQFGAVMDDGMKGSGLGLAIAHSLVKLHDGSIHFRSIEGRGTIVHVHLPAAERMREAA